MEEIPHHIKRFLLDNAVATVATISSDSDYPHVVPVFYIIDDKFHIFFGSHHNSKKVSNIHFHPQIGISITDISNLITLQLHGNATIPEQKSSLIERWIAVANNTSNLSFPPIMKIGEGSMELVEVEITWFRLSDYSKDSVEQTEGQIRN